MVNETDTTCRGDTKDSTQLNWYPPSRSPFTLEPQSKRPWIAAIERFAMNPWFASVMLTIGMYGLFIEMGTPGLSIPGIIALLCFALFLWSKELNGTVDALEVVLIVVGILCLAVEIFIIPGFGVFGFSGLALIFIGLVLASQTFIIPQNNFQIDSMIDSVATVIFSVLGVIVLYIGLTRTLSDTRFGHILAPARSDQQQQADTQWNESLMNVRKHTSYTGFKFLFSQDIRAVGSGTCPLQRSQRIITLRI